MLLRHQLTGRCNDYSPAATSHVLSAVLLVVMVAAQANTSISLVGRAGKTSRSQAITGGIEQSGRTCWRWPIAMCNSFKLSESDC